MPDKDKMDYLCSVIGDKSFCHISLKLSGASVPLPATLYHFKDLSIQIFSIERPYLFITNSNLKDSLLKLH